MIVEMDFNFSDDQVITADAPSTNVVDLSLTGKDLGPGEPIPLEVRVKEAFNTLTSLNIIMEVDDDVAFGSAKEVTRTNVLLADLTLGAVIPGFQIIPDGVDERYMRLRYDVVGTDPTLGKIFAGVVAQRQTNRGNL